MFQVFISRKYGSTFFTCPNGMRSKYRKNENISKLVWDIFHKKKVYLVNTLRIQEKQYQTKEMVLERRREKLNFLLMRESMSK